MKKLFLVMLTVLPRLFVLGQSTGSDGAVVVTPPVRLAAGESTTNFIPETVGPLCAVRSVKGDKDFSGNGPIISSSVTLSYTANTVVATLTLHAKETKGDMTEIKNSLKKVIYTAPEGYQVTGILSGKSATVQYVSDASFQSFKPGELKTRVKNSKTSAVIDRNDGLVAEWLITGDTNGDDIGPDCNENTRVSVRMNAVRIKLKKLVSPNELKPATENNIGTTINLEDINEWLCPNKLVRGDREFDGHGPKVKCEVKLRIGPRGASLLADISFSAIETVHDWSTTEGKWTKTVYEAPSGKKITAILSDKASRTQFISPPGGFQFLAPGADVARVLYTFLDNTDVKSAVLKAFGYGPEDKSALSALVKGTIDNGNTVVQVPPTEGTLVKFFHIVGDTGGPDISDDTNCNDDTRIVKLEFFPVKVKMADVR